MTCRDSKPGKTGSREWLRRFRFRNFRVIEPTNESEMPDLWITVKIKLKWLYAAVIATREQSIRDHQTATKEPGNATTFRAMGDAQWDAHQGPESAQKP